MPPIPGRPRLLLDVRLPLLLLVLAGACGPGSEIPPPPRLDGRLVTEMTLGGDPDATAEYLLGRPRFVRTDDAGDVYVADAASMTVRVYDSSGAYLRTLGGRGREPGRFLDVTCLHVDPRGRLVVADGLSRSVTRFLPSGKVEGVWQIGAVEMLWPRQLLDLGSEEYLFLYKMPDASVNGEPRREADLLLHRFDGDFRKLGAFGDWTKVTRRRNDLVDNFFQIFPGNFWVRRDGTVLYAPRAYLGTIHRFAPHDDGWREVESFRGDVPRRRALELVDADDFDKEELSLVMRSDGGRDGMILRNESRGLFELSDGRIVHFTAVERGNERVFGAEIFTADGSLLGYAPLETVPLRERGSTSLPWYVLWKDAQDRFYLHLKQEVPEIRIARLVLETEPPPGDSPEPG